MGKMKDSLAGEYTPLSLADHEARLALTSRTSDKRAWRGSLEYSKWTLIANITLFFFSLLLLLLNMLQTGLVTSRQGHADISWSPVTDDIKANSVRFNETFFFPTKYPSKFAGPPSPAVDAEWAQFTKHEMLDGRRGTLAVSRQVAEKLAKSYDQSWLDSIVKIPNGNEDRYMALLEMFHHVHCLDMLRKASYFEYYTDHDPREIHVHLDHCIESLREVLMCNSGTGVAMFHWVQGDATPYPDYNTYHQCRNPYDVLDWALDQAVPVKSPIQKGDDDFSLEEPPY